MKKRAWRRRSPECGKLDYVPQVAIDGNGRILVVDDDALIRDTLATALGDEGYAVRVAPDGRAALSSIGNWRPDVIVIVLSAAHEVQSRAESLEPAAVFTKPFDLGALLDAIASVLDRREPSSNPL